MPQINAPDIVKRQYKTPANLTARISIHEKYSVNKQGFPNWIFSNYLIPEKSSILELGCGTGSMWKEKLDLLNNGSELILTDISEGMVETAREALGEHANISYGKADIMSLPYEKGRFNIVIANMMLYHVTDLDRSLSEVKRVLKDKGVFYCTTFGENGIIQYISRLLKEYGAEDSSSRTFTLQNGGNILNKYFSDVKKLDYEDSLMVTDINDILDYIYSMSDMLSITGLDRSIVKNVLEKNTVNGVINIPKDYGMFICEK